jgi:hypothetical protein
MCDGDDPRATEELLLLENGIRSCAWLWVAAFFELCAREPLYGLITFFMRDSFEKKKKKQKINKIIE